MTIDRRRLLWLIAAGLAGGLPIGCLGTRGPDRARLVRHGDVDEFLHAVQAGDAGKVRRLLAETPALARSKDAGGRSAFILAHLAGHPDVAGLLLERGLELDIVEAVLAEDWNRVTALAEASPALIDAAHPIGGTPLYAGALVGSGELYRLRALGCDPDGRPEGGSGWTPARAAMECRDLVGASIAATDLLGNRSNPNAPQRDEDTVLHGAVRRRDLHLVRMVVRKGGDVTAVNAEGLTPAALAERIGWREGEALLRGHHAIPRDHITSRFAYDANRRRVERPDLSDVPQQRQNAVTGASHVMLPRLRELVAQDDRLIFSISTDGELAIEACGHTGQRPIIRFHLDHGAPLSLPTAVSLGDVAHARFLLEEDPLRIHERGPHDFALMWYPAIGGGSVEMAELLLNSGTHVDQESLGNTGLHWAAEKGDLDLVRFLAERGADVNAVGYKRDRAGQTPLDLALQSGREGVAGLLRDLGART